VGFFLFFTHTENQEGRMMFVFPPRPPPSLYPSTQTAVLNLDPMAHFLILCVGFFLFFFFSFPLSEIERLRREVGAKVREQEHERQVAVEAAAAAAVAVLP